MKNSSFPLTAHMQTAVAVLILIVIGFLGLLWNGSNLPETSRNWFGSVLSADLERALFYGVGLMGLGILGATRLRGKQTRLLRGAALAVAVGGGYNLLAGLILTAQRALPWPRLPEVIRPLFTLAYGGTILLAGRRYFFQSSFPYGKTLVAFGLGCLISAGWAAAGVLGTTSELFLAILEALGMGLLGAIWMVLVFFYMPKTGLQHPRRAGILAAMVFAALAPGLFAVRGWSSQGSQLGMLMPFYGLDAAGILISSRPAQPRRDWWAGMALLFAALLLPLAFTKGAEGDWVPGGLPATGGTAGLISLVASLILGVILFAGRRWLARGKYRVVLGGLAVVLGVGAVLAAYLFAGKPGLQPETFFVVMTDQADTRLSETIADLGKRREAVFNTLTRQALTSQYSLRAELDRRGVRYKPYYLINGLEVYGGPSLRRELARRPDVARILDSPHMRPQPAVQGKLKLAEERARPAELPWGISAIRVDRVWQNWGITGQGVVVGTIGSGVDWQHPDLRQNYLGGQGNHDYTWYDPWESTREPVDTNGIGTHTLATVVGQTTGVAPEARWMACRSLARDLGNLPLYLDCMQFLLAPFPQAGDAWRDGDPSRGAQVINASFICPPWEGCDATTLSIALEHLKHAGQMFVSGAGNEGPACSSILPPGLATAALTVGAIGRNSQIAAFSGRGPVTADGSGRGKPDLVAPGVGIISSLPDERYAEFGGTSMAAAHVSGVVALLWSANPALAGDIERTKAILTQSAQPFSDSGECRSANRPAIGLSNVYGAGMVDAFEAVKIAREEK